MIGIVPGQSAIQIVCMTDVILIDRFRVDDVEIINHIRKKVTETDDLLWALRDSNPRPSGCKPDALNQLS
jgi:hypothetical protein